jgi:hypothetical protein
VCEQYRRAQAREGISRPPVHDKESTGETGRGRERRARLRKGGLQLLVFWWLSMLANGLRGADPTSEAERMLIDSGVYEELRQGEVQFETDR